METTKIHLIQLAELSSDSVLPENLGTGIFSSPLVPRDHSRDGINSGHSSQDEIKARLENYGRKSAVEQTTLEGNLSGFDSMASFTLEHR